MDFSNPTITAVPQNPTKSKLKCMLNILKAIALVSEIHLKTFPFSFASNHLSEKVTKL